MNKTIFLSLCFVIPCTFIFAHEEEPETGKQSSGSKDNGVDESPEAGAEEGAEAGAEAGEGDVSGLEALNDGYQKFDAACEKLLSESPFNQDEGSNYGIHLDEFKEATDALLNPMKESNQEDQQLMSLLEKFENQYQQFLERSEKYLTITEDNIDEAFDISNQAMDFKEDEEAAEDKLFDEMLSGENKNYKDQMEYEIADYMASCLDSLIVHNRTKLEEFDDKLAEAEDQADAGNEE